MMIKVPLKENMDAIVKAIDMHEYAVEMQHKIRAEKEKSNPVISQYLSIIFNSTAKQFCRRPDYR